jgi:hypothetical protein
MTKFFWQPCLSKSVLLPRKLIFPHYGIPKTQINLNLTPGIFPTRPTFWKYFHDDNMHSVVSMHPAFLHMYVVRELRGVIRGEINVCRLPHSLM